MSDFIDHLHDVFSRFGPIRTRAMFGGHGVYHDGVMFALVHADTLYLKEDRENAHHFDARGLEPFVVDIGGKPTRMSYRRAPDEVLDDPDAAAEWGRIAFEAAVRARRGKGKAKKAKRGSKRKGKGGR